MKNKLFLFFLFFFLPTVSHLRGNVIGYVEDFALAPEREVVLKDLIPGTREYYYYHALHAQSQGDHEEVAKLIKLWIKRHGNTSQVREIQNREALLIYEKNPAASFAYLMDRLRLRFNHSRKMEGRKPSHPIALDPKQVSYNTFYQDAVKAYKNLKGLEDKGLRNLNPNKLNPIQLRDFLGRIRHPDIPNLPALIIKDLKDKQSRGFGSLNIHRMLTKKQLDELRTIDPKLINSNTFVQNYLTRLTPSPDQNLELEKEERTAWLNRQLLFVKSLPASFNSLKANLIHNLLKHRQSLGEWDRELFMEYLSLPRPMSYFRKELLMIVLRKPGTQSVNLNNGFSNYGCFPPIRNEVPLVRAMLLHFLKDDADYKSFSKFLTD